MTAGRTILLATVHWAATRELSTREPEPAALTELVRNWSDRKGRLFTEVHVGRAAGHLADLGWLDSEHAGH
jgi:hypothetical protein